MTKIPFCDPGARFAAYRCEIMAAMTRVVASRRYILGPEVEAFEAAFANYIGTRHCIGAANGTDAITLALVGLGIGAGQEVICPAFTAHGTATGIIRAGAQPVFADVSDGTRCLDPESVAAAIGPRTAAIVVVHLHGNPRPVEELASLASKHHLALIEDAAQAHGARIGEKRVGTFGAGAAFSFYPTKNLGCMGDGGAVVTGDAAVADRMRKARSFGWNAERVSEGWGMNSRLDELQAAILSVLLPHLDDDNRRRRSLAKRYDAALSALPVQVLPADSPSIYHQYAIATPRREALRSWLMQAGIETAIHYPLGLHRMPAYPDADLPTTDRLANEILSLPIQPEIAEAAVEPIISRLLEFRW